MQLSMWSGPWLPQDLLIGWEGIGATARSGPSTASSSARGEHQGMFSFRSRNGGLDARSLKPARGVCAALQDASQEAQGMIPLPPGWRADRRSLETVTAPPSPAPKRGGFAGADAPGGGAGWRPGPLRESCWRGGSAGRPRGAGAQDRPGAGRKPQKLSARRGAPVGGPERGQEPALSSHFILMSALRGAAPQLPQSAGGARAQNRPRQQMESQDAEAGRPDSTLRACECELGGWSQRETHILPADWSDSIHKRRDTGHGARGLLLPGCYWTWAGSEGLPNSHPHP